LFLRNSQTCGEPHHHADEDRDKYQIPFHKSAPCVIAINAMFLRIEAWPSLAMTSHGRSPDKSQQPAHVTSLLGLGTCHLLFPVPDSLVAIARPGAGKFALFKLAHQRVIPLRRVEVDLQHVALEGAGAYLRASDR